MRRKPIRVLAAVAAIVLAGFAVAFVSRDDTPDSAAFVDMNHGDVRLAKGQMQRVLNAARVDATQVAADQLVAKGRKIFRDPTLFENGETCQTCHAEGGATAKLGTMVHDTKVPELNVKPPTPPSDFDGPRDPPALWDLDKTPPYFWSGNVPTLERAVATPVFGHMKMFVPGGDKEMPPGYIDCQTDSTRDECEQQAGEIAAALIAYIKTLKPPQSAFDDGTMSKQALDGEKLFQGKGGCIECHGGPDFTDNLIHNTGVPQVDFTSPYRPPGSPQVHSNDLGAPAPPADPACTGTNAVACDAPPPAGHAFVNTPQMRDLKDTAPYMHNGAFKTLKEVVDFYNTQSTLKPLNLTPTEVDDLVAYLESL